MTVALRHYEQALKSYRAKWYEASNGQLRSALEAVLMELGARAGKNLSNARSVLDWLKDQNLLSGSEWDLGKGLLGISHDRGAHAGLTDEQEARFRLSFTTTFLRYLLHRIKSRAFTAGATETYKTEKRWYDDGHLIYRAPHGRLWVHCPHEPGDCEAPSFWLNLPDVNCHLVEDFIYEFHKFPTVESKFKDLQLGEAVPIEWTDEADIRYGERFYWGEGS